MTSDTDEISEWHNEFAKGLQRIAWIFCLFGAGVFAFSPGKLSDNLVYGICSAMTFAAGGLCFWAADRQRVLAGSREAMGKNLLTPIAAGFVALMLLLSTLGAFGH